MALPGVIDPVTGVTNPNPLDPATQAAQSATPAPVDFSSVVGLTGADHYNIQRLTRAHTYLSGAGTAGYPDLASAAALAPTDWTGMDQHIQALGGTPGYGVGVGQLMDHLTAGGTPKVPVADISTLQQTMVKQGFLLPGQASGIWDSNSAAGFKAMEDYNYNVAGQGQKPGGAGFFQFLGWLNDALPPKVSQALVGTAKFLFGGIAHTINRNVIEAAHAPGSYLASALPFIPGLQQAPAKTLAENPEVQAALAQHGLAGGSKGNIEDLTTVLSLLPLLKGAGVFGKGLTEAGASALGKGLANEAGASALTSATEGAASEGLVAKGVRSLVGRSIAKDVAAYAADPAAAGDMLSEFATKPMSLRGLGQGFLNAADQLAAIKSTPLGQVVTSGLNAATQASIYERGVANLTTGTVAPNIKLGKEDRSLLGSAIDNTSALGATWNTSGPLSILGNPLDLSAFIWAPTEALDLKGLAKATVGEMAHSLERITPTSDLMPLIRNTGMSREDLVNAFGGEPYLKQFMRYTALQAAVKRDATIWVDSIKNLKPGSDGWEVAMQDKAQEIEAKLKANPLQMEAAISSATSRDMLDQIKYMFTANPEILARRGQGAPVFQNWADAMSALNGTTAADANVNTFSRGSKLWTDANQDALNQALEPFFAAQKEVPTGRPVAAAAAPQALPPLGATENYPKGLAQYAHTLYRETDAQGAQSLLMGGERGLTGAKPLYFSNSPEMALGQGANTGVHLEVDPAPYTGTVNMSKPGAEFAYQNGKAEFIASGSSTQGAANSIRRVTIDAGTVGADDLERTLQRRGFIQSEGPNGEHVWAASDTAAMPRSPRMTGAEGNVLPGERAGGGTVEGSHYVFGEQMAGDLGKVLGSDATIALRRADNALGSAQQLASWKVVWDRLGSVTESIATRLAAAAEGEAGGLIELPKRTQVGDLQAAGFSSDAIAAMREPNNLGLVGAKMTPQQATDFLSHLSFRVDELKTVMNKYNPETAKMDPGELSSYSNRLTRLAPRDVTLSDADLHEKLLNLGYQPIAMHPGAVTLNDVGAGTAEGLSNAASVAPVKEFLGIHKVVPEELQFMRTNATTNELGNEARLDPTLGQDGKEVMSRVYDTARAASDAGMSIFGTNLKLERSITDLRQLSPKMLQTYGGFTAEQSWNVYGAIRRGAAFGFDISKPIQTLRNLGEALQYNGIPGMEDAIRTLVTLRPNTKVPFVDGVAGHILNLPDHLARLRDFVQFSMSPQFSAARVFKTKILRGTEGLPFDFMPAKRIEEMAANSGNSEEFYNQFNDNYRKVMGESRGNAYATLLDNPDFGIRNPGSGVFGHTTEHGIALDSWRLSQQVRAEQGIAADADLSGSQYQAIKAKVNKIYGYGARSGLEKSANYIFFPLSFDLKVAKAIGGWMLQDPARILVTTMGLQSYNKLNSNNRIGGFVDQYLPLLSELNKINFFSGGFHTQLTYAGGRNTTLYNMGKDVNAFFHSDPRLAAYVPISVSDTNLPNALGIMGNLIPAWRQMQTMGKAIQSQLDVPLGGLAKAGLMGAMGRPQALPAGGADQWQVDNYYQETKALKQAVAIQLGNAGMKPSFSSLTDPFGNPNSKISPEFFNQVQAEIGKIEAKYPAGAAFAKAQSANYQTRSTALDEMFRKPVKSRAEASMLYFSAAYYDLQAQAQSSARANAANGARGRALYQSIAGAMAQGTTPPTLPGDLNPAQIAQLRYLAQQLSEQAGPEFERRYNLLFKSELGPLTAYDQAPGVISPSGTAAA